MKKFERLPVENRKEEIKEAAKELFAKKGFQSTTMENIISEVSLSKGGVYRIYPSTKAILKDIIIDGMRRRNVFYRKRAQILIEENRPIDIRAVVDIICDGMVLLPEVSTMYAELLIEKQYDSELEELYQRICQEAMVETGELIQGLGLSELVMFDEGVMWRMSEIMNATILAIAVLNHYADFEEYRQPFQSVMIRLLQP